MGFAPRFFMPSISALVAFRIPTSLPFSSTMGTTAAFLPGLVFSFILDCLPASKPSASPATPLASFRVASSAIPSTKSPPTVAWRSLSAANSSGLDGLSSGASKKSQSASRSSPVQSKPSTGFLGGTTTSVFTGPPSGSILEVVGPPNAPATGV